MKKILLVVALLGSLTMAHAQTFTANLDSFQEVPPHNTPAYGLGDFTLDLTSMVLTVDSGSYASLLGGAISVTLNDGPVGASGPLVASLTLDTPGATSGTFSGTATLTSAQITDLNAGNFYVNVRDSVYPSGEIRDSWRPCPSRRSCLCSVWEYWRCIPRAGACSFSSRAKPYSPDEKSLRPPWRPACLAA